jgi:hypothetical protein
MYPRSTCSLCVTVLYSEGDAQHAQRKAEQRT